ncbi:MAG TPA: hypothetical protein VGE21_06555 [Flavobacteriales bacterium]
MRTWFILVTALATLMSCKDLSHVGKFARGAAQEVATAEQIEFTLTTACLRRCEQAAAAKLDVAFKGDCACAAYAASDTIRALKEAVVVLYFSNLAELANDELTAYSLEPLTSALANPELNIPTSGLKEGSAVTSTVLKAFTEGYRRKHVVRLISQADQPLQAVLKGLQDWNDTRLLQLQATLVEARRRTLDVVGDDALSRSERSASLLELFEEERQLRSIEHALLKYREGLSKIAEGHESLRANLHRVKAEDVRRTLVQLSQELKELVPMITNH